MVDFALRIKFIVISSTKINKWNIIFEYVVNGNQHCMGNSNRGKVDTSPDDKPLVLCRKE